MSIHLPRKIACLMFTAVLASPLAMPADMSGIIKVQVLLGQVEQVMAKYEEVQALLVSGDLVLDVAEPRADVEGKFIFPYSDTGLINEWAEKSLNAQAGAEVGGMAGEKAAGALASKVPFGGLAGGLIKGKSKELAAVTAIGGWDYIKETSSISFDSLEDYSLYMHVNFNGGPDYEKALAAAMAIYPELEKSHQRTIDKAMNDARKAAARKG
jgi:hypothetical protein